MESTTPSEETPDFSEIVKPSRGPPGGGRLIREGAPAKPAGGPPSRGPPVLEAETPTEQEDDSETLAPVQRPVLQPVARRVLTPVDTSETEETAEDKPAVIKPVGRAVLKPISEPSSEEEE